MINNSENNNEAAFEAELYNSLKLYGYLFPENVPQVEAFEQLYGKNTVNTPLIEDILSADVDASLADTIDLEMGIAAYSNPDDQFPELLDDEPNGPENNDQL